MKEFDFNLTEIFGGITPRRVHKKQKPQLLVCHNLQPVDEDYILHELITDMNSTGDTWGGLGIRTDDIFIDHSLDTFVNDSDDNFIDD